MTSQPDTRTGARVTLLVDDGIVTVAAMGTVGPCQAGLLRDRLRDACEVCIGVLAVDLSGCSYLSDAAVTVLWEATRRSTKGHYRLHIIATDHDVIETLEAADLPSLPNDPRDQAGAVGARHPQIPPQWAS